MLLFKFPYIFDMISLFLAVICDDGKDSVVLLLNEQVLESILPAFGWMQPAWEDPALLAAAWKRNYGPEPGFCGMFHRVGGYIGYTWIHLPLKKDRPF